MSVGAVNKQTGERIPTAGMPAIDSVLSGISMNPVQNRVVKAALDDITDGQNIDSFAEVETALAGKVDTSSVGSANGVAELDANGRVPSAQLPSYVDDVLEYADLAHFPATGETGKIYIAEDTNKTYRWSGSDYAEISESLALGETSSTAYAGNKGKANADAIAGIKNGTSINSFGAVETALAGKADGSVLADYASLDNSGHFPDANTVTKELVYINGYQSGLTNYPSEVSNTVGILLTRWFYYSGDLTVARMQLVFTLGGKSFCRFTDGTSWTPWEAIGVGRLSDLTTTDKSSCVGAINELDWKAGTFGPYNVADATDIKDFIRKVITQADADLASKPAYKLYHIFSTYHNLDNFHGTIERQDTHGYSFAINAASGNVAYRGYCDLSTNYLNVYRYTSIPIGQATLGTGFIASFHDGSAYRCFVPFPFWASDTNYTVALNGVSQVNVGNVLASASVETKYRTGFVLAVSGTYDYSKCGIAVNYTVTLN